MGHAGQCRISLHPDGGEGGGDMTTQSEDTIGPNYKAGCRYMYIK